jgi:PKD repeat protein
VNKGANSMAIDNDGNLIASVPFSISGDELRKYVGVSSSVTSNTTFNDATSISWDFVGNNLMSSRFNVGTGETIQIHDGFSTTITSSIELGAFMTTLTGFAVNPTTGDLTASDQETIYVFDGLSNNLLYFFDSPVFSLGTSDLAFDQNGDLLVLGRTEVKVHRMVSIPQLPVNILPVAGFTFTGADLDWDFTDASTDSDGIIDSYFWEFGDGNTSTDKNPSYTFLTGATNNVCLTVTDNRGGMNQFCDDVVSVAPATLYDLSGIPAIVFFSQGGGFSQSGYAILGDGTHSQIQGGGETQLFPDWTAEVIQHYVRLTVLSGPDLNNGNTTGTWHTLGTRLDWAHLIFGTSTVSSDVRLEISDDAGGSNILATKDFTITVVLT